MITSTANAQVKKLVQLLHKPKIRREQGVFVVEGMKMFLETPGERIVSLYVSEKFLADPENRAALNDISYEVFSDEVFRHISDTVSPQGILAVVKREETALEDIWSEQKKHLFLLLEDIQDPGNLGTMLRTGEAVGVSAVIMSKNTVDVYNPKVIRSTMGAVFRVPFFYVEDMFRTIQELRKRNTRVVAAHLKGEQYYYQEELDGDIAFVIGNEAAGLSDKLSSAADCLVKIPMEGHVESLNASVAASVLLYEAYRQRNL